MAKDWRQVLRDSAQQHIAEPVIAAGLLAPAGAAGSFGLGKISPVAAMGQNTRANERSGGLGHTGVFILRSALIAVTAHKVYGFNAKPKGRKGWQVVDQVGEWDRSDVSVSLETKRMTRAVTLEITSTGERFELEMMLAAGTLNDPLFEALTASVSPVRDRIRSLVGEAG
jgi:hypothetical protein